jgi:hypothetical protein
MAFDLRAGKLAVGRLVEHVGKIDVALGQAGQRLVDDSGDVDPEFCARANDEDSRPALRDEMSRIDGGDCGCVALALECRPNRLDRRFPAPMRGKQTGDVFEHNRPRRAPLGVEPLDQSPERPKGASAFAIEPDTRAGFGDVLAGRRSPGEIRAAGQIRCRETGDVGDL